jgi:hypothetical protein
VHIKPDFMSHHLKHYAVYQYGSSLDDDDTPRDVDLLVVTPEVGSATCQAITDSVTGIPINTYYCPTPVFADDVRSLRYGGYYCHKLILSHSCLAITTGVCDAAALVWWCQARDYRAETGMWPEAENLMVWAHRRVFRFNPTFARSLLKLIKSSSRRSALIADIAGYISAGERNQQRESGTCPVGYESVFYRFWTEYERHKGVNDVWSERTMSKIAMSCADYGSSLLADYFSRCNTSPVCNSCPQEGRE